MIDEPFQVDTKVKGKERHSIKSQREPVYDHQDLIEEEDPTSSEDIAIGIAVPTKEELEEAERAKRELEKLAEPFWLIN